MAIRRKKTASGSSLTCQSVQEKFRSQKRKMVMQRTFKQKRLLFDEYLLKRQNPEPSFFNQSQQGAHNQPHRKPKPLFSNQYQHWHNQNYYQNLYRQPFPKIKFNECPKNVVQTPFQIYNYKQCNIQNYRFQNYDQKQPPTNHLFAQNQNQPLNVQHKQTDVQELWKPKIQPWKKKPNNNWIYGNSRLKIQPPSNPEVVINEPILTSYRNYIVYNKILGSGTYSKVYLGIQTSTRKKVAIKEISELEQNQIKCLMSVDSPHIIKLNSHWKNHETNMTYLVLDLCRGNLREEMKKCDKAQILKYFDHVIIGMDALISKNLLHRDLKFQNILVSEDGNAKITDFGLAKDLGNMSKVASLKCGTPYTMAPQVFFHNGYGRPRYSHKCDIWSLGVILHQMLYRKHPFAYDSQRMYRMERVSIKKDHGLYDKLIDKSLVKEPSKRIGWSQFMDIYKQIKKSPEIPRPRITHECHPKGLAEDEKKLLRKQLGIKQRKNQRKKNSPNQCHIRNIGDMLEQVELEPDFKKAQIVEKKKSVITKPLSNFQKIKRLNIQKQKNFKQIIRRQPIHMLPQKPYIQPINQIQKPANPIKIQQTKVRNGRCNIENYNQHKCRMQKLTLSFLFFAVLFVIAKIFDV